MALQSSGPISLGNIQTEFGGTNPISISEYYAVAAGVPASGTISISDFYGTSASDVIPNAVNWADISSLTNRGSNAAQTISGISSSIDLRVSYNVSWLGYIEYMLNVSGTWVVIIPGDTVSVSNGDSIMFRATNNDLSPVLEEVTISNASSGETVLDTFTCDLGAGA